MKKTPLFKMKTSIKLILIHLTVLSCVRCDEITVSGSEGGDAVINCPYPEGYESTPKYLWKGEYTDGVDMIRSNGRSEWTHRGRVSLQDKKDRNIFTVIIHNLTLEDAGTYGCGVDKWGDDFYTIVNLKIAQKSKPQPAVITTATPGVTTATPATTSDPPAGHRPNTDSGNTQQGQCDYSDITFNPHVSTTSPTPPSTDPSTIYANVQLPSNQNPDSLQYATVRFTDPPAGGDKGQSPPGIERERAVLYSSINL